MAKKKVDSIRHKEKRTNIPTEELRDFVAEDERTPKTMLYPRDPSLDPQLVWKGKDEQDRQDLAVPVVPIYIQEKIHPNAIVSDLLKQTEERNEKQLDFFGDFNGLNGDFEKKIDFYSHQDDRQPHWSNRMILGDSLLVMASLAEKEGLKGKVQTIYFDPPYGIKFGSNWQVSTRKRDVTDGKAEDVTRQPEQIRAFRDTWKLGVHSYLAYIRDRLAVARELLTETGSIFVQIGDENVHVVRCVIDEIFGPENFITQITFSKTSSSTREYLGGTSDFILFYAKSREHLKYRQPYFEKSVESEAGGPYSLIELPDGARRRMTAEERDKPSLISKKARVYRLDNLQSQSIGRDKGEGASCWFPVEHAGKQWLPNARSRWKTNERGMAALKLAGRLESTATGLYYVRYIDDFPAIPIADNWTDTVVAGFASDKKYVVETSTKVIERCLLMTTDPGDIVLDPTCGSGTTAYVAEQWGRRWVTIDTSRVALALARTRLMAARYPYYLLADSPEGRAKARGLGFQPKSPAPDGGRARGAENPGGGGLGLGTQAAWEYDPEAVAKRVGAYLPHWTAEGATYAVTFRLADSLPQEVLKRYVRERDEILERARAAGREPSAAERDRLRKLHSEKVESYLDAGHGACVLRDAKAARIVAEALGHFDGDRYDLLAWCVMPNHVHVVARPRPGRELPDVLHSWKSFTSNQINRELGRTGALWQAEYYDHLIRDQDDLDRSIRYVLENPGNAGLTDWPWRGSGFQPESPGTTGEGGGLGLEARATKLRFVYKRVPHVTLKSIANNPDIKEGMTREEIDRAIARHSETETLFDQPYDDPKRLRVTGPFTVESLSPHRVLSTDEEQPASEAEATRETSADFATMIIENLKKAGVQNTVKNERLVFETLEPFAGTWIHAAGTYTEADGAPKRVAVSLGPEHGTIGPDQVKEAAKEAVQGIGYDILILCGFAFDPHVSEETKRYGNLTILATRMNPDLAMGDELLKKTGGGNLFMVFGEPDLDVKKEKDGTLTVEVRGVDVYDPTTGRIRNSSTDDIACWFLDTNYDGESFFVRHAYFTGADEPYEKLKRALKAEVDEAAWASLHSTKSRPFPKPASGKIAVKVINHYGDEVLKVLTV